MLKHLPFLFKNLLRSKRRSALAIASVAASLCLLGLLMTIYRSFFLSEATEEQSYRLIVRNKVSLANPLPRAYQPKIQQVDGVKEAMILQWFGGTYKDARDQNNFFARFAVEPRKVRTIYSEFKMPEEQWQAFFTERRACIVGAKLARQHGFKPGDRITIVGDIFPVTLDMVIRGVYAADSGDDSLYLDYAYLDESLTERRRGFVGAYAVRMNSPGDAARVPKAIDDMFRNSPQQTKTETEKAFALSFLAFLGNVKVMLLSICAAVTFTILLVTGNTMAMSVRERTREVGVLKTIGFTPQGVLSLLVGESVLLAAIGGVFGLLLTSALCGVLRQMPSTFADNSQLVVTKGVAVACMAVAAAIGLISSVIPAWPASRLPIVEALRVTD
ncbi:MAG: FtsX-like permease family protein [Bryobacteraceae bacterium]